jgi:hypothetical protein
LLGGASNQNYTVQVSTNLASWNFLFVTNNPTANSFMVIDTNTTNVRSFYRILVGP